MGNMNMGGVNQATVNNLTQSYMNAVTKPNVSTYEAEMGNASMNKTLIGVAAVAVVSAIMALLRGLIGGAAVASFMPAGTNSSAITGLGATTGFGGFIITLIITPIAFFLGAGILYLMAKILGGQGNDFGTHAYLLSLSYTPLRIVAAVLSIIPVVGGLVGFVLGIYQLYSAGLSMQASQRLSPGKAMAAAFIPAVVGIVLFFLCAVVLFASLFAAINGATTR